MVRTWHFSCYGPGSIPGWGINILQAVQHSHTKKKKKTNLPVEKVPTPFVKETHLLILKHLPERLWNLMGLSLGVETLAGIICDLTLLC